MANQVICNIMDAEKKADEIIALAQLAARESVQHAQQELNDQLGKSLSLAKTQAKEKIIQKKELLNQQEKQIQEENKTKYEMIQNAAALKMQDAADFIVERIIK